MKYYKNLSIDESDFIHYVARPFRAHLLPKLFACICMEYHSSDSNADGRCAYRKAAEETGFGPGRFENRNGTGVCAFRIMRDARQMGEIHFESHIKHIIYIKDYFRVSSPLLP